MPKLRKMLGSADDEEITALMRAMETQSLTTLAGWGLRCAEERYLPLLPPEERFADAVSAVRRHLSGELPKSGLRPFLAQARKAAQETEGAVEQAAARAVATACAVAQTPTNALGFTFYGAAAAAYHELGLSEGPDCYDACAAEEFTALRRLLEAVSVEAEPHPVHLQWNC